MNELATNEMIFCRFCARKLTGLAYLYHPETSSRFCDHTCYTAHLFNPDLGKKTAIADQPPPMPGKTAVWPYVVADIEERVRLGRERYGTELMTHNGRDALIDAYQEILDAAFYVRQAILERDGK